MLSNLQELAPSVNKYTNVRLDMYTSEDFLKNDSTIDLWRRMD